MSTTPPPQLESPEQAQARLRASLEGLDGLERLKAIMRALRDPVGGCPWDLEQDFASILPYTLEEAFEVADAIERQDWAALQGELGDLLLQVVYHAQLAQEQELFDFDALCAGICNKMETRHPHVFGATMAEGVAVSEQGQRLPLDAQSVEALWEKRKAEREKASSQISNASVLDGVGKALPQLMRAEKLQKRAASQGFDWPNWQEAWEKLDEEQQELKEALAKQDETAIRDELGDMLFSLVNVARKLGVSPQEALRKASDKFERRFRYVEQESAKNADLDEMQQHWLEAKKRLG